MHGIFVQCSRFGFLFILWWLVFRIVIAMRKDTNISNSIITKSRISQVTTTGPHNVTVKSRHMRATEKPSFCITIITGGRAGDKLVVDSDLVLIGRASDCDLIIDDEYSSNYHARLSRNGDQWFLEDLGSTNGTFIENSRVHSSTTVQTRDPIRIGKTIFTLQHHD